MQQHLPLAGTNAFVAPQPQRQRVELARGEGVPLSQKSTWRNASGIMVEVATAARLAELQADWDDLIRRAESPNVFMNPALVRLACEAYPDKNVCALLAWHESEDRRLVGIWAFAVQSPQGAFIRVLSAPQMQHAYLATPVIDRDRLDDTLDAMLDHIAAVRSLPKIVALDPIGADGTMQALMRVLTARGSPSRMMGQAARPRLASELDGKEYLTNALSSGSRKKLRQHRRRLAERGNLEFKILTEPAAVRDAFETFLQLEASGWKGRQGTALLDNDADAGFARSMITALVAEGAVSIHALMLDVRPVSIQIVLRAGAAAFTWKTAYDEALQDASPGMLLLEDYTAAFLADDSIAFVDSCSYDDKGFMGAWTERQPIASLWIDARRGGSVGFAVASRLHHAALTLRGIAKMLYLSVKEKWRRPRAARTASKLTP